MKKDYASHHLSDSHYNHTAEMVKGSVLGFSVALTLGFAIVELVGGLYANSLALVGDAGHMVTDSASLFFALVANWLSRKGADEDHSFGHARIEVLAAFINALAMMAVIFWIFKEAITRLYNPVPVAGGTVIVVAVVGLIVNLGVAWSLSRDRKNLNTRAALVHVMGDMLGSLAAILSGALVYFGGSRFVLADPILSFFVGFLVLHSTWKIIVQSTSVLLDAVPNGIRLDDVGDALTGINGVNKVHDLHVWMMTPGHSAVAAHIETTRDYDWEVVLRDCRTCLSKRFGIDHTTLQPEYGEE